VSGNVSFYNHSTTGKSVDPSPIIACVGVMKDYTKAITMSFKKADSSIFILGKRKHELGGSVYYETSNELGKNIPKTDFDLETKMIHSVIKMIDNGLLLSCHDISDGGMITAIAEMAITGDKGVEIDIAKLGELRKDKLLFSETSGFVFEVEKKNKEKVEKILKEFGLEKNKAFFEIGKTTDNKKIIINHNDKKIINTELKELSNAWKTGLDEAMK